MKTDRIGFLLILLAACGDAPSEATATDSGTGAATEASATTSGTSSSPSADDVSDSVTPTTSNGSVSDSQTDTGDTTATTNQASVSDSDATSASATDSTGPSDPSLGETTAETGDPQTDTGDTTGGTTGTSNTTADDTTSGDDTTGGDDETTGEPVQCGTKLSVTIRDFLFSHPDFEDFCCGQPNGMVKDMLGPNGKPVYNNPQGLLSTPDNFAQWYTDVPGVNQKTTIQIELQEIMPGVYSYSNNSFFPIDNMLWGNEGQAHNYHFTTEIHAQFQYNGGEVFTFSGDDDVWVFVNKQLAIDIGGVHGPTQKSVNIDSLGLNLGQTYPLDVFHAERHTVESNFRIDTTICSSPQ